MKSMWGANKIRSAGARKYELKGVVSADYHVPADRRLYFEDSYRGGFDGVKKEYLQNNPEAETLWFMK